MPKPNKKSTISSKVSLPDYALLCLDLGLEKKGENQLDDQLPFDMAFISASGLGLCFQ